MINKNKKYSNNLKIFLVFLFLSLIFALCLLLFSFGHKEQLNRITASVYQNNSKELLSIELEIAQTPRDLAMGLMGREYLQENSGMLFIYDEERSANNGFWMYQTKIPLDIAFLNENGEILSISQMSPCLFNTPEDCPLTYSKESYNYVVEMNYGFFDDNNITIGDNIKFNSLQNNNNDDIIKKQ